MATDVLAGEIRLDLWRIDPREVVSKWVGETEKRLRRISDAAEAGGAVLPFDESEALLGRRSEVKDSHDRFANIEVSYLLQRTEDDRGLGGRATNRREALDPAFLRSRAANGSATAFNRRSMLLSSRRRGPRPRATPRSATTDQAGGDDEVLSPARQGERCGQRRRGDGIRPAGRS